MTYTAFITRIKNVRKHPDADRLQIGECFGNQVIIGMNQKSEDIGIYFPADGRLSDEFLTVNNLVRKLDTDGKNIGGLFDVNGKVRTQKLRGEKSDGFFCPIEYLNYTGIDTTKLEVGFAFSEVGGHKICDKFITIKTFQAREKKQREKSKFINFHEMPDTEQLAYRMDELKDGMFLVFTEKVHGTSQRSANSIEEKWSWYAKFINGIYKRTIIQPERNYNYVCGTRHVVLKDFETHVGFYKENEKFREYAHNRFVNKLRKGETVYYEIVGYAAENTPIMPSSDNTKLKDKEFIKKYGKITNFTYGCHPGQHEVYVYRISMTNEDGVEIDLSWDAVKHRCDQMGIKYVPELFRVLYNNKNTPDSEFLKLCDILAEGSSTLDSHIREGVVVRSDGTKWNAWKYKSFSFKVIEGIIKETGVADREESQETI